MWDTPGQGCEWVWFEVVVDKVPELEEDRVSRTVEVDVTFDRSIRTGSVFSESYFPCFPSPFLPPSLCHCVPPIDTRSFPLSVLRLISLSTILESDRCSDSRTVPVETDVVREDDEVGVDGRRKPCVPRVSSRVLGLNDFLH